MAKRNTTEEMVYQALEPKISEMGFVLIDVIYRRENKKLFLRLLVDKKGGINVEECALINETLDPFIENELGLKQHDYFEVSSPGLERPLTEPKEFEIYAGQLIEVRLYQKQQNQKVFCGELLHGDDSTLTILEENTDEEMTFALSDVAKISRIIRFN